MTHTHLSAGSVHDLLPCPFCGGRANIYENEVDFVTKWSVGCGDCNCNMDVCEDTKTEAAACWNARTLNEPQTAPTVEDIAKCIWFAEGLRVGIRRSCTWENGVSYEDQNKYRYIGEHISSLLSRPQSKGDQ